MARSTGMHGLVEVLGRNGNGAPFGRLLSDSSDQPSGGARLEEVRGQRVPRAWGESSEAVGDDRGELALAQRRAPGRGESATEGIGLGHQDMDRAVLQDSGRFPGLLVGGKDTGLVD